MMLAAIEVGRDKSPSAFGTRLRSLRAQAALTQTQLGERAGMLYQVVARLERGEREPTWPTVLKLAEALGVSPNDFLDGDAGEDDDADPPRPSKRK